MLKMKDVKLGVISDIDLYQFSKNKISFSYITQRYSKVSNVCIESSNKEKPSKYIIYNDVGHWHRWEMSEYILFWWI